MVLTFERLDYAVNCAGILGGNTAKAVDMPTEAFDGINSVNYRGVWLSCRAQLRNMLAQEPLEEHAKQRGAIVNLASQLGIVARPGAGKCCNLSIYYNYLFSERTQCDINVCCSRILRVQSSSHQHDSRARDRLL